MRKSIALFAGILLIATAFGQVPQKMSYQAVIRNNSSQLVINHKVGLQLSILHNSVNGPEVYSEVMLPTTNENGLISIEIGNEAGFDMIDWSDGAYFLKTEIDPEGGSNYTISGISQLLSVPFALYAGKSSTTSNGVNLTGNQLISGEKTFTDIITGTLNANNTNILNVATPLNSGDAVNKAYVDALERKIEALYIRIELMINDSNSYPTSDTSGIVTDIEGNKYNYIKIGNQFWMTENLKTGRLNDGTEIPYVSETADWIVLSSPAYCWYNNDSIENKNTYGGLYNWYVVETGKLCPAGWHVPSDSEWKVMESFLGINQEELDVETGWRGTDQGNMLKSTTGWNFQGNGTNTTGFTGLPGGYRSYLDVPEPFKYMGVYGYWWSSTELNFYSKWNRALGASYSNVYRNFPIKTFGQSVRCIKN